MSDERNSVACAAIAKSDVAAAATKVLSEFERIFMAVSCCGLKFRKDRL
jgi:hypothetical protein